MRGLSTGRTALGAPLVLVLVLVLMELLVLVRLEVMVMLMLVVGDAGADGGAAILLRGRSRLVMTGRGYATPPGRAGGTSARQGLEAPFPAQVE